MMVNNGAKIFIRIGKLETQQFQDIFWTGLLKDTYLGVETSLIFPLSIHDHHIIKSVLTV